MPRTFALIPAAGHSRRMGRPKLSLPLAGRTILEHVLTTLRAVEISDILVVIGPRGTDLTALAEAAGARVLALAEDTADMRATVERGLDWLEQQLRPATEDAWLLLPADHPVLEASVIRALLQARAANPRHSIVIPTHSGRRGHPALIGWEHVPGIRSLAPGQGLNGYLRSQSERALELPVASPSVLVDLDTPEDYARLLAEVGK